MGQISNRLTEYSESDFYAFHMPGHKRMDGPECVPYRFDITEIDGFDNLHHPENLLKTLPDRIQKIYGCNHAWVSLNGGTGGILMAVAALCEAGDTLLMARNCHQAVYHAAELLQLRTIYLYPEQDVEMGLIQGAVLPETIEAALVSNPQVKTVLLTSPTYEGICSDIFEIARIVHEHGAKLIVDAAHGAHLGFDDAFPTNPISLGADVVVMSTHKTLSAVTQTAIVCANCDEALAEKLQRFYDIFMSSSPSYPMMCSVEYCLDELESDELQNRFAIYKNHLESFRTACRNLKVLQVLEIDNYRDKRAYDFGKIIISTQKSARSGPQLMEELRSHYHLECEMAAGQYVLAMTSIYDTKEGFDRLKKALLEMDSNEGMAQDKNLTASVYELKPKAIHTLGEAMLCEAEWIPICKAGEKIAAAYVYAYPPGIPILAPGEIISKEWIELVEQLLAQDVNIGGIKREDAQILLRCVR